MAICLKDYMDGVQSLQHQTNLETNMDKFEENIEENEQAMGLSMPPTTTDDDGGSNAGIKDSAENISELLMGDRNENSLYQFQMFKNETQIILCKSNPLTIDEFKTLKERINEMYQVNLNLNNLPTIRYSKKDEYLLRWTLTLLELVLYPSVGRV
ncbi:hypothetical protein OSB04_017581 [Centaurea solstitialis]|uniref:Transmembrane 9 superfamily member n=1 Tax=Centaurea solstitialis TaxID=347529 RepID=A0AA38WM52_9ASTR|nr:hypothetical protein OSB04_017581 [Centaurea solstitialis]